ncbi:MAG: response regulator transcription factor [Dehalococcoidales bacterium]|nr:response regulator transcription factor [Dehalococcoidales bacterium]
MGNIRIFLIDDHQVVREGLRRMLELETDIQVIGEANNAREALTQLDLLNPEIILVDIKMPDVNGIELTRQIKAKHPTSSIIMLTLYDEYLAEAIEAGAVGYLLKDVKREELVKAIRAVHQGLSPLNLSLSRTQLAELAIPPNNKNQNRLTERELSILRMIAEGITTKEIANQLFLSQASVKRSVRVIFDKMEVRNRSEAVSEAHKKNII